MASALLQANPLDIRKVSKGEESRGVYVGNSISTYSVMALSCFYSITRSDLYSGKLLL